MGFISDMLAALSDYQRNHKEHMTSQWEKQAAKQKAAEPRPLTETQLAWQKMQQERAEVQPPARVMQQVLGAVAQPAAAVPVTPVYTITWQVRLSSLGNIPLPWAEAN